MCSIFHSSIHFSDLGFVQYEVDGRFTVMPRSHIHGLPRRFHYGSNHTDDPGIDHYRSPIRMHNASTTTYDYGCNTETYRLIRIATVEAGSYPWLILRQIRDMCDLGLKVGDMTMSYHMTMSYQLITWNGCLFVHTRDRTYFKLNVLKANSNCERFKCLL